MGTKPLSKLISTLLAFVLCLSLLPSTSLAAGEKYVIGNDPAELAGHSVAVTWHSTIDPVTHAVDFAKAQYIGLNDYRNSGIIAVDINGTTIPMSSILGDYTYGWGTIADIGDSNTKVGASYNDGNGYLLLKFDAITVTQDVTVTYIFAGDGEPGHTAASVSGDTAKGTVSAPLFWENAPGGGSSWVLAAKPAAGYGIDRWAYRAAGSGGPYTADPDSSGKTGYTVTIAEDREYIAYFTELTPIVLTGDTAGIYGAADRLGFVYDSDGRKKLSQGGMDVSYMDLDGWYFADLFNPVTAKRWNPGSILSYFDNKYDVAMTNNAPLVPIPSEDADAFDNVILWFGASISKTITGNVTASVYVGSDTNGQLLSSFSWTDMTYNSVKAGKGVIRAPVASMFPTDTVTLELIAEGHDPVVRTYPLAAQVLDTGLRAERQAAVLAIESKYNALMAEGFSVYSSKYLMINDVYADGIEAVKNATTTAEITTAENTCILYMEDASNGIFHTGITVYVNMGFDKNGDGGSDKSVAVTVPEEVNAAVCMTTALENTFPGAWYLSVNPGGWGLWINYCGIDGTGAVRYDTQQDGHTYSVSGGGRDGEGSHGVSSQWVWNNALIQWGNIFNGDAETEAVIDMMSGLPKTADTASQNAAQIAAARMAYDALTLKQQGWVPNYNYNILLLAEAMLITDPDVRAAGVADALIAAIGAVAYTQDSLDKIIAAYAAYDAASVKAKGLVTKLDTLTAAKAAFDELAVQAASDAEALIAALPAPENIKYPGDSDAVASAQAAYNMLLQAEKDGFDTEALAKLNACAAKIDELKGAADPGAALIGALGYIQSHVTNPTVGSTGGEWAVLALARAEAVDKGGEWALAYLANLDAALAEPGGIYASDTDYERVTLALTALGIDASDYNGADLTSSFSAYGASMTVNAKIFALLALNSKPYPSDSTDDYITGILAARLPGGGWTYSGSGPDVDMTAMAIQALAPSYSANPAVKSAVDTALNVLKGLQDAATGGFTGMGGNLSTCSTAQVVTALCSLDIDPAGPGWTTASGKNPLSALLTRYNEASGFFGETSASANQMATEQAAYALVAYDRLLRRQNPLYDMSDAFTLSNNAGVRTVSVKGYAAAAGADNTFTVKLPYGSDLSSVAAADITVTAASSKAGVTAAPVSSDGGATWRFTVTAEDGTPASYTLTATVAEELAYTVSLSTADNNVRPGQIITVGVDLTGATTFASAQVTVTYDTDKVTYASETLPDGFTVTNKPLGEILITRYGKSADTGALGTLSFTVKSGVNNGDAAVFAVSSALAGLSGTPGDTRSVTTGGSISVKLSSSTPGGNENNVNVTFRLIGSTRSKEDVDLGSGDYKGAKYVTWIAAKTYAMNIGDTMYEVFVRALADAGLPQEGAANNYVRSITAPTYYGGFKLSEFTNGTYSGWMYTVNGRHPGYGLREYELKEGDDIVWHYVNDFRYEISDWFDDGKHESLATDAYNFYDAWLKAEDKDPPRDGSVASGEEQGEDDESVTDPKTPLGASGGTVVSTETVTAETEIDNGKLTATVETEAVIEAVTKAKEAVETAKADGVTNAKAEIKIAAKASDTTEPINSSEVNIPAEAVKAVADANDLILTVESDVSTLTLGTAALTAIAGAAKDGETIKIASETIDNSVIDLTIRVGDNAITDLGGAATVILPYTPAADLAEADYDLLTVYYLSDDGSMTEIKGAYYDAATGNSTFDTDHLGKFLISEWLSPFDDIAKGDWYYRAARYAYSNGLITGTTSTTFAPQSTLTRAMLITILARDAGIDTSGGETWYSKAVDWGMASGLTDGTNMGNPITREQFATLLYRYRQWTVGGGVPDAPPSENANLSAYTDTADISDWAQEAMAWAVSTGLITGRTETTLAPLGTANRAEAATLLQRYLENIA